MPQLDRLAYISEEVWLLGIFILSYLIVVSNGLKNIYKILSFRVELLERVKGGQKVINNISLGFDSKVNKVSMNYINNEVIFLEKIKVIPILFKVGDLVDENFLPKIEWLNYTENFERLKTNVVFITQLDDFLKENVMLHKELENILVIKV